MFRIGLSSTNRSLTKTVDSLRRMNVEKVLERDGMISALDERADALKEGAEMFEKQAGKLEAFAENSFQ